MADEPKKRTFKFLKHDGPSSVALDWETGPQYVRKAIGESLNARNIAILLGAGCSSAVVDDQERGISTMAPLAKEFCSYPKPDDLFAELLASAGPKWSLVRDDVDFLATMGVRLPESEYSRNLERLMELLHSLRFVFGRSTLPHHAADKAKVEIVIDKVRDFIWERCTSGEFARGDDSVLKTYEVFYRKLILRDRSLPRPWVFTTNYDLFNERAMDRLGLPYTNGFSGVIERRFNPATFRYALAEQLDVASRKWSAVDGFVYLCKLHGSISWTEDNHGLYPVRELWPQDSPNMNSPAFRRHPRVTFSAAFRTRRATASRF